MGDPKGNDAKGSLVLVVSHCDILYSDGRGSWTNSGSQDGAVHNPPEILALEPKLHLVNPDIVIRPIKDGDGYFDVVGGCGGHVVDRLIKRSLSARDLSLKKKLKEDWPYDALSDIDGYLIPGCF